MYTWQAKKNFIWLAKIPKTSPQLAAVARPRSRQRFSLFLPSLFPPFFILVEDRRFIHAIFTGWRERYTFPLLKLYIYCDIRRCDRDEWVRNDGSCFSLTCADIIRGGLNERLTSTGRRCTLSHAESWSVWRLRGYTASVHATGVLLQTLGGHIVVLFAEAP